MIRQRGSHLGKTIVFGFDRYLLPDLDDYLEFLRAYGDVEIEVDNEYLHYLSSAQLVAERVQGQTDRVGVLCCGTGMGMSIAANKFRGIYATRCMSVEDASDARAINNANVLCLASRSGLELNRRIVSEFLETPFEGRKVDELAQIAEFELEMASPAPAGVRPISRLLRQTA